MYTNIHTGNMGSNWKLNSGKLRMNFFIDEKKENF